MQRVKERNLELSLLLDPSAQVWTEKTTETSAVVSTEHLHKSVAAFKDSLKLPTAELRRIEQKQEIITLVFCTQVHDPNFVFSSDL